MTAIELWQWDELVAASGGAADRRFNGPITGISIDTRTLGRDELFVALKDQRDGHEFVSAAFERGAAAALVSRDYVRQPGDGALVRVEDPLGGLERIGIAARARLAPDALVVAVTGSAGKTGTKEMLRAALAELGPVHASDKSFNNHWGVPLTLARMPANTRFAVFEIGMNHPGEILPLSRMVRPHIAIVTTVEPVHLAQFGSVEEIADAKAEIFAGLGPGGIAILNRDNPHYLRLGVAARRAGARIIAFGRAADADVRLLEVRSSPPGQTMTVDLEGATIEAGLSIPGEHIAMNALAVFAVARLAAARCEDTSRAFATALGALRRLVPPPGRGTRTQLEIGAATALLIDESYNANPASMRAALATMAGVPRDQFGRRIAVLGDMLELGAEGPSLHSDLKSALDEAGVDLVFASGPLMRHLFQVLPPERRGGWAEHADGLKAPLLATVTGGDVVMVKGSNGSRMAPLVEALKSKYSSAVERA